MSVRPSVAGWTVWANLAFSVSALSAFPASLAWTSSASTTDSSPGARRSRMPGAGGLPTKQRRPQGARRVRVRGARGGLPRSDYKAASPAAFPD